MFKKICSSMLVLAMVVCLGSVCRAQQALIVNYYRNITDPEIGCMDYMVFPLIQKGNGTYVSYTITKNEDEVAPEKRFIITTSDDPDTPLEMVVREAPNPGYWSPAINAVRVKDIK